MKISRKMKKFLLTFLAGTLSIIMFATQVSASNIVSYVEYFEHDAVDSLESILWDSDRDRFIFALDLTCYESDDVECVKANLELIIQYPESPTNEIYQDDASGDFTPENTWDSDEIMLSFSNFSRGYDVITVHAYITYEIHYNDEDVQEFLYQYNILIYNNNLTYTRTVPTVQE